ncbi:LytR/AlgR family response regulator transcription factor [Yunchengibacter salinarum]|uniref:LytR/AlgR family response regulator transcription factor n=1 Tax=Yunchengibacter salinarum TaxID=3133399 RepID=UPI0035B57726
MIRALLVDDEPLALRGLSRRLAAFDDLDVVGTCSNGRDAVRRIREEKPDLIFLDIQMPGFDGFAVLRALVGETAMPMVIFVTAYDQYALDAFEAHALDYLLKPVDEDRLADAVARARDHLAQRMAVEQTARLVTLLDEMGDAPASALTAMLESAPVPRGKSYDPQIRIKDRGRITIVDVADVDYIDAAGDYMCIHVGEDTHILRETMKTMEKRLDPAIFQRIHRSTIVNLERVSEVRPHSNGECFLTLKSGGELKVSRSYKSVVARFL